MEETTEIDNLIAASFVRVLLPDEDQKLMDWIARTNENRKYYLQLKNIWEVANPAFPPESIDLQAARRKVLRKISRRSWIHSPFIVWWEHVAAILLVPLSLLTFYLLRDARNHTTKAPWLEASAPFGTTSRILLSDGSAVWLNAGSRLKYPAIFSKETRLVVLSGEAYFEVHSDKHHPFVVKAGGVHVKATGTQFNVEAYPSDSLVFVSLIEGHLDVGIADGTSQQMKADQRITCNLKAKEYTLAATDAKQWGAWKDGKLIFRNQPLGDVLKRIGRIYNVEINIKNPAIARIPYRATFEGEPLEEILRLLKLTAPLHYQRSGKIRRPDGTYTKETIEVY